MSQPLFTLITIAFLWLSYAHGVASQNHRATQDFYRLESYPHALTKPFLDKYLSSRFYDYGGNTVIKSDSYIRLTGDRAEESGWLFSKLPAMPENFQVEFDFKLHGNTGSVYGDGLAFWLTSHRGGSGTVFGSMDRFEGLGIFFDTYENHRPGTTFPHVMAMVGDGQTNYDHGNDGRANELGSCSAKDLHNANGIAKARVTFVKEKFLSLDLDYQGTNKWTRCFVIDQVKLPQSSFLGFSARTGQLHENHEVHRVQVYSLRNPPQSYSQLVELDSGARSVWDTNNNKNEKQNNKLFNKNNQNKASKKHKTSGSWLSFFLKVLLVVFVILLGIVGYAMYITKNKQRRRRQEMEYYW